MSDRELVWTKDFEMNIALGRKQTLSADDLERMLQPQPIAQADGDPGDCTGA
jgi:hypothetical protein